MKMLFINSLGQNKSKVSDILPRVGDKVDMFYVPIPTVTQVLLWPSEERLKALGFVGFSFDAIITIE